MIVGDRLSELREAKKLSHVTLKSAQVFFAVIFPASRMVILSRPSKHWRKWPERWNFRSTIS